MRIDELRGCSATAASHASRRFLRRVKKARTVSRLGLFASASWSLWGLAGLLLVALTTAPLVVQLCDGDATPSRHSSELKIVAWSQPPGEQRGGRGGQGRPRRSENVRNQQRMLAAFQEVVAQYWTSTVRLYQDQTPLAMGVIVDSQGWVVTKASQLVDEPMECQLSDGRRVPAELRRTYPDLDLALVKLPVAGLAPVSLDDWASPRVGGWLATVDAAVLPLAIGVVSTPPRAIQAERAVLGVGLGPVSGGAGATVNMVLPGSGAEAAGLEVGDRLLAIDGRQVAGQEEAFRRIKQLTAGQRIVLDVQRGDAQMSFKAQVMDLNQTLLDPTEMEVNGLISARATGFERVFQHDTVLSPDQCGGLVVDLQGRPIGLNIARAGRVNSYALPSEVVVPAIRRMLAELPTRPSDYAGNGVAQAPADSQPPGDGATRRISLPAVD